MDEIQYERLADRKSRHTRNLMRWLVTTVVGFVIYTWNFGWNWELAGGILLIWAIVMFFYVCMHGW